MLILGENGTTEGLVHLANAHWGGYPSNTVPIREETSEAMTALSRTVDWDKPEEAVLIHHRPLAYLLSLLKLNSKAEFYSSCS